MIRRIEAATRATAVLVDGGPRRANRKLPRGSIEGYPIRSESRPLPADRLKALQRILLDRQSRGGLPTRCLFSPNIAYRLRGSEGPVDVLVCHSCDQVIFRAGKHSGGGRFNAEAAWDVEAIASATFPEDSTIRVQSALSVSKKTEAPR